MADHSTSTLFVSERKRYCSSTCPNIFKIEYLIIKLNEIINGSVDALPQNFFARVHVVVLIISIFHVNETRIE